MLGFLSNNLAGLLVAPFVLQNGAASLRSNWRSVLAISLAAAAERNLTNASLYYIGAALKTALHGFNVLFTFFIGMLFSIDEHSKRCLFGCKCKKYWLLTLGLILLTAGNCSTLAAGGDSHGNLIGIVLQLGSSVAYAIKFSIAKIMLGDGNHKDGCGKARPSKLDITFVASPFLGVSALAFLPFLEDSWDMPASTPVVSFGVQVLLILVFELRLTELTSPLTVSVLAVFHNVVIVLIFVSVAGESLSVVEAVGYAISTLGCLIYARFKYTRSKAFPDEFNEALLMSPKSHLVAPVPPSPDSVESPKASGEGSSGATTPSSSDLTGLPESPGESLETPSPVARAKLEFLLSEAKV